MTGGGSQTTTTKQELSPEQRQLINLVIPTAESYAAQPPTSYPGSTVAPFTPLQEAGQLGAVNTAFNFLDPFIGQTAQTHENIQSSAIPLGTTGLASLIGGMGDASGARNFLLSGDALYPGSNPALEATAKAAVQPFQESLMQQILPGIRQGAQTAGQYGGSRQGLLESQAINNFLRQAGDTTQGIYSDAYGRGLQAMVQALQSTQGTAGDAAQSLLSEGVRSLFAAPSIADLALLPSQVLSGVGGQQQMQEQNVLQSEVQKYMTDQMMPFLMAQDIANLAFGFNNGSVTSTGQAPGTSPLQMILGIGSMMAGLPIW